MNYLRAAMAEAMEREQRITRAMVLIGPIGSPATSGEIKRRTEAFAGAGKPLPDVLALESLADDVLCGRWDA